MTGTANDMGGTVASLFEIDEEKIRLHEILRRIEIGLVCREDTDYLRAVLGMPRETGEKT